MTGTDQSGGNMSSAASSVLRETRASWAFVERNYHLTRRYLGWEIVFLAYSLVSSLSILFIGASMEMRDSRIDGKELILYLLVGTLVWSYLGVVFDVIAEMISWERWEGTIEYTFMAPITRATHLIGSCVFGVAYGFVRTGVILGIIALFFEIDLRQANFAGAVAALLVGSVGFVGLGIMAATLPLMFTERGAQMTQIVRAALLLVSGVYYPIEVLPGWMQSLALVSPATYVLEASRRSLLFGAGPGDLLGLLWPLALTGVVCIPLGLFTFGVVERYVKRTGRLKRSG
jgi:ABC-2 type transport system permease protein